MVLRLKFWISLVSIPKVFLCIRYSIQYKLNKNKNLIGLASVLKIAHVM